MNLHSPPHHLWFGFWIISGVRIVCVLIVGKCHSFTLQMLILSSIEMRSEHMRLTLFCQETHYDNWKLNEPLEETTFRNVELEFVCHFQPLDILLYISGMKLFCKGLDNKYSRLYFLLILKYTVPNMGLEVMTPRSRHMSLPSEPARCPYIFFSFFFFYTNLKCRKLFLVLLQYKNGQLVWDQSFEGCW